MMGGLEIHAFIETGRHSASLLDWMGKKAGSSVPAAVFRNV